MRTVVYIADTDALKDPGCFSFFLEKMDEGRKKKIASLAQDARRRQSLAAGILLLQALEDCRKALPKISCNAYGKPYFPEEEKL